MEPPRYYQQPNMNAQFNPYGMNAQVNPYAMNAYYPPVHYPALRVISTVLQVLSLLVVVAGLIGAIFFIKVHEDLRSLGFAAFVVAASIALILLAYAELVKVFADISISTRATLNQVIDTTARKAETENKQ